MEVNLTGVHHSVSRGVPGGNAARGSIASSHVKLSLSAGLRLGALVYALLLLRDGLAANDYLRQMAKAILGHRPVLRRSVKGTMSVGKSSRRGEHAELVEAAAARRRVNMIKTSEARQERPRSRRRRSPDGGEEMELLPLDLKSAATLAGRSTKRSTVSNRGYRENERAARIISLLQVEGESAVVGVVNNYCILIIDWIKANRGDEEEAWLRLQFPECPQWPQLRLSKLRQRLGVALLLEYLSGRLLRISSDKDGGTRKMQAATGLSRRRGREEAGGGIVIMDILLIGIMLSLTRIIPLGHHPNNTNNSMRRPHTCGALLAHSNLYYKWTVR